ncbi:LPS export ABC transporter permease LptG [Bdellovibrio svalbardensis]|uniref:LPS export ABC transporter permease LptG n=1 Tax=Bdellovibrio svalbardensis TaxID=2972972 RepID=A0ABT6DHA3_9BACT|nr:LPS export ABC transporter permease LptG [Bdellovibrio svalbardensis]MDG0815852.1 LPS export ABC transporter permease LptG [Bdellovibrio svalbardensis]
MNRIDRYTSWLFWGYFIGGLLVFLTLFTAVDAMSTLASYKAVTPETLFNYYIYSFPEIIQKLLPVACLMGTILTLTNLNKANELVALFASGMSLLRISTPILAWVILLSGLGYMAGDRIVPTAIKQKNYIFYYDIKKEPHRFSTVKTNKIWYRTKDAIFNIKTLSAKGDKAQGLTMYFFNDNWDLVQMMTAHDVEIKGSQWLLQNGTVTVFSKDSSFPLTSQFKNKSIVMAEDSKDLQSAGQTANMMTQKELEHFINKNKDAGLDTVAYEVDYHSKISFAFAGLVMCLLGIPFSVGRARSGGTMLNVGICLGLVFAYYVLYSSGITLGQHGTLPPLVAAWAPNLLMGLLALVLLKRLKR